jgi:hypothetical protein
MRNFVSKFILIIVSLVLMAGTNNCVVLAIGDPQGGGNGTGTQYDTGTIPQSDIALSLQEKINTYNSEFCPPRTPITQINRDALIMLVEKEKTRGTTAGNQDPEKKVNLQTKTITYRDKENRLQRMIIYFPTVYPVKDKPIEGKTGETIQDYATSVLLPKNGTVSENQKEDFKNIPSSDGLVEQPGAAGGSPVPGTAPKK